MKKNGKPISFMKISSMIMLGIIVALSFLFSSCTKKTSGYFVWKYENDEQTEINICGLTNKGYKQTFLEFPAYIKKKPVTSFGGPKYPFGTIQLHCDAKTIYLPETTEKIIGNFFVGKYLEEFYVLSTHILDFTIDLYRESLFFHDVKAYLPVGADTNYSDKKGVIFTTANVTFYYNYENSPNEGVFWIIGTADNVHLPKNPARSGYKFNGWYNQAECITAFDFGGGYAENEILSIYAGWVKK